MTTSGVTEWHSAAASPHEILTWPLSSATHSVSSCNLSVAFTVERKINMTLSLILQNFKQLYFYEIWNSSFSQKSVKKLQDSLQSNKTTGTSYKHVFTFVTISRRTLLRMINVSYKSCRENQNTYFTVSKFFFGKSWCLYDNVEKYGGVGEATDEKIIRFNSFTCGVSKTTRTREPTHGNTLTQARPRMRARAHAHTHTEMWNNYWFLTATIVSWIGLNVMLYIYSLSYLS
jgi:hypothetical protein